MDELTKEGAGLNLNTPHSLAHPPFKSPWWLSSGHAQTLAAAYWTGKAPAYRATARQIELPDGDIVVVHDDCPIGWNTSAPASLLLHGLAGSHQSPLLARLATKLTARGGRVFRFDFRGCGAGKGMARRPYHAGCSDDLSRVIAQVLDWCADGSRKPHSSSDLTLNLLGISLGGNVLLKYLGEAPERVPTEVRRAVAINPPIDLAASVQHLQTSVNRLYDRHFVKVLTRHSQTYRPADSDREGDHSLKHSPPRTMGEFDDLYTAPKTGYGSAREYYEATSAAQFIPHIRVPTTIMAAANDPLVPKAVFQKHAATWPKNVAFVLANGGGHLGYVGTKGTDADRFWLDWRIVEHFTATTTEQDVANAA